MRIVRVLTLMSSVRNSRKLKRLDYKEYSRSGRKVYKEASEINTLSESFEKLSIETESNSSMEGKMLIDKEKTIKSLRI